MSVAYDEQAEAVRTTAAALGCWADVMLFASERLAPVASWRGPAADTAAEAVERLRAQTRRVAEAPERGAAVLRTCAAELEQAAALQRRAATLTGGDATRLAVEADAVAHAAVQRAAVALYDAQPAAPRRPHWLGRQLLGFGRGAWCSLRDLYDVSQRMSPQRALFDPRGAVHDRLDLAQALAGDVQHPVDALQALAGTDQLRDGEYGEWLGGLVAGAVIPGGKAGRLDGLVERSAVRLVDRGGPVRVRIGLRLPRGYPVHIQDLKPGRRTHILDGDDTGGGHRAGTPNDKSKFPADWSDDLIIHRVMRTAMKPEHVEPVRNGCLAAFSTIDGVHIRVIVDRAGHVVTAHPVRQIPPELARVGARSR